MESLKKKILVLDPSGMAGHVISKYLGNLEKYQIADFECDPLCNSCENYIDIYDQDLLHENIKKINPDVIINCLRILIEESETNVDKAIYFNSFIPHYLSKIGKEINAKVIQLSTDCVFSGKKGSYNEDDFKDGETIYARTKALGELNNERDLTLRTSFIGPNINGRNEELFHWFLMRSGEINGYSNVYWTGITTLELAKSIDKVMDMDLCGVYHLVPKEKISKYDLLELIKMVWKRDNVTINKFENFHLDKSLIDNRNLLVIPNYPEMFEELYKWMSNNEQYFY